MPAEVYKKGQSKFIKTWHSLTLEAFFEYMYKVWNILDSFQDFLKTFVLNLFILF